LKGARPVVCPAHGYVEDALNARRFPCSARFGSVMRST
jgi:hypothetical protein